MLHTPPPPPSGTPSRSNPPSEWPDLLSPFNPSLLPRVFKLSSLRLHTYSWLWCNSIWQRHSHHQPLRSKSSQPTDMREQYVRHKPEQDRQWFEFPSHDDLRTWTWNVKISCIIPTICITVHPLIRCQLHGVEGLRWSQREGGWNNSRNGSASFHSASLHLSLSIQSARTEIENSHRR